MAWVWSTRWSPVAAACAGQEAVMHTASVVHTRNSRADDVWNIDLGGSHHVLAANDTNLATAAIRFAIPYPITYAAVALAECIDILRGGTLGAEDGLSRFAVRYMCTHHYFNIDKARRDLGYQPRVTIDEGIELTAQQLEAQGLS